MALQLVGLEHGYGRRRSLRGVSLTLERGDRYAFLGHNGAGKTTTLRIAAGLTFARAGQVLVDGMDASAHPREARARIGALIEAPRFHASWSGRSNLVAIARLRGMGWREARLEADRVLELVGMTEHGRRRTGAYSQGMRQRLGIGQALLGSPHYVLLDEPLNGLDPEGIASMRELFDRLGREDNVGVLLSSHQLADAAGFCDRVSVVQNGVTVCEDSIDALVAGLDRSVLFRTDDREAAQGVVRDAELDFEARDDGLRVKIDGSPARLVRDLVGAGVGVEAVVPARPSLEEIYLRVTRGEEIGHPPSVEIRSPAAAPSERRAPRWPSVGVARYELRRLSNAWTSRALWLLPIPIGLYEVDDRRATFEAQIARMRAGELFDVESATAFEGLGMALRVGVPILLLIAVGFCSQSVAGEWGQGTLRNVLLSPVRRSQAVAAKLGVMLGTTALMFGLLALTAWIASAAWLGVDDKATLFLGLEDTLDRDAWLTVDEMSVFVWPMLGQTLLALLACAGFAFLCGTVFSRGVVALGAAFAGILSLDVVRGVAVDQAWLSPLAYLPSPLQDDSSIRFYLDSVFGMAEAQDRHGSAGWWVSPLWLSATALLAILALRRRTLR